MNLAAGFLSLDGQTWVSIAIGGVVTLIVALIIYRLQKSPRTLDYAIRSVQDLTPDASPHLKARMEITWIEDPGGENGRVSSVLKEPRITNYRIRNTGKRSIRASDFQDPITVEANSGSIVDIVVTDMSHERMFEPGSIAPNSEHPKEFRPVQMNAGDWIDLQVITDGCAEPPVLKSWLDDETRPMRRQQSILDPSLREVFKRRKDAFLASDATSRLSLFFAVVSGIVTLIAATASFLGVR